jgi:hypothetical protein
LMNLSLLTYLDICFNHLYTSNSALRDFLNSLQPGWESCQSPPFARAVPCVPFLLFGE